MAAKLNLEDFQGAEADCDAAIQRNPFVVGAYQIRGLARIRPVSYTHLDVYKRQGSGSSPGRGVCFVEHDALYIL